MFGRKHTVARGRFIMIRPMIMEDLASVLEIYNDAILNITFVYRLEPESLEEKRNGF